MHAPVPQHAARTPETTVEDWRVDLVLFGDADSEQAHGFAGEHSRALRPSGDAGSAAGRRPARVALPLEPPSARAGDLRFVLRVDPLRQNYLSLKLSGDDASDLKTIVFVNQEQASYRSVGDYEPINVGTEGGLPGRFFFTTAMLPLASTQGHESVEITLRTYKTAYRPRSEEAGFDRATDESRRFFEAFTHTRPVLRPEDLGDTGSAPQRAPSGRASAEREQEIVDGFRRLQLGWFTALSDLADHDPAAAMPISRYRDDLRFYAECLLMPWSPAFTADEKGRCLGRIFASIDTYAREYFVDIRRVGTGGHQSDWGGYYAALGEALYICENLIADPAVHGQGRFQAFLDQPFATGTSAGPFSLPQTGLDGAPLTRRTAWERVLKANFDFARSRLSYITNQVMYTYEGAWKAHEGLRVIGSRFYEGKERSHRILREALGLAPFWGEEILTDADGRDLDVYHSLFHHDRNAIYTEDQLQIVMKGLAESARSADGTIARRLPYGRHHTGLSAQRLMRENGYVGVYGETMNYLPCWFFRTLGHTGDEELNDDILRLTLENAHARGMTRYSGLDSKHRRTMFMEQVVDGRNSAYPGRPAYGADGESGAGLRLASLEQHMAENPARFAGPDWDIYWEYAREAVGWAQQQLLDDQFFPYFAKWPDRKLKYDLRLNETYAHITQRRRDYPQLGAVAAGRLLPHTDAALFTPAELEQLGVEDIPRHFAWADIDNLLVSLRDGETHLFANLTERNCGFTGTGRAHIQHPSFEQLLQFPTDGTLAYREVLVRGETREELRQLAADSVVEGRPFALTGELVPVAQQPGIGPIRRENFNEDNPYSGLPDLAVARLGRYLIAINTTRPDYGNDRSIKAELPGPAATEVLDLVSGTVVPCPRGRVAVPPMTAYVLRLADDRGADPGPGRVHALLAMPGGAHVGLTWKAAPGAASYMIIREDPAGGTRETYASGPSLIDPVDIPGTYRYRVAAVDGEGRRGPASQQEEAVMAPRAQESPLPHGWREDALGTAISAQTWVLGSSFSLRCSGPAGFGDGDDAVLQLRHRPDALSFVSRLSQGSTVLQAKVLGANGHSGIMLRDSVRPVARYIALGVDESGRIELRTRTLDTREDYGVGNPGDDAHGGETRSPYRFSVDELSAKRFPWLRLTRDALGHRIAASVSEDGHTWRHLATAIVPMPHIVNAGLYTTGWARIDGVAASGMPDGALIPHVRRSEAKVHLSWNKPRDAVAFSVLRTQDDLLSGTDPSMPGWAPVEERTVQLSITDTANCARTEYAIVAFRPDGSSYASPHRAVVRGSRPRPAVDTAPKD